MAGILSVEVAVASGVPDGSMLAPLILLYELYNEDVNGLLVQDDFELSVNYPRGEAPERAEGVHQLQRDVNSLADTCRSSNPSKCEVLSFGLRIPIMSFSDYHTDSLPLKYEPVYKDCDTSVDVRLKFHQHVDTIVARTGSTKSNLHTSRFFCECSIFAL